MAFLPWRTWATNQVVTAAELNQDIRDNGQALFPDEEAGVAWSPTLEAATTNPTTSSVVGVQYRIGAIQFLWVRFVIDTGGAGPYSVTVPNALVGLTGTSGGGQIVGTARLFDLSTQANRKTATVQFSSSTSVGFALNDGRTVTHGVPFAWATGDVLTFEAHYPFV